jgi:hypothetical protein
MKKGFSKLLGKKDKGDPVRLPGTVRQNVRGAQFPPLFGVDGSPTVPAPGGRPLGPGSPPVAAVAGDEATGGYSGAAASSPAASPVVGAAGLGGASLASGAEGGVGGLGVAGAGSAAPGAAGVPSPPAGGGGASEKADALLDREALLAASAARRPSYCTPGVVDDPSASVTRTGRFTRVLEARAIDLDALRQLSWSGVPRQFRVQVWQLLLVRACWRTGGGR